tara:strand:- start:1135 stop:2271 length:1137 start_codon:yes stop_codon:yes gene_type:complete
MDKEITEITEGSTKLFVPSESMTEKVPPKEPAFFNPKANLSRDLSIIAYSAFWKDFEFPKIFFDGLTGLGARALRVANEIEEVEKVIANDVNPDALELALKSAKINGLKNFEISEDETCRFLSSYSKKDSRASIVDIDPFGSPSRYIDCAIRATMHGGMLALTATDLQVLHGLFNKAAKRRYYGTPIKTEFSNEIAIRLILGCVSFVAGRLDISFEPLFVDHDMHYYRTYLRILNTPEQEEKIGYIIFCRNCKDRHAEIIKQNECRKCGQKTEIAGPLWIGSLFQKKFVNKMKDIKDNLTVNKRCERIIERSELESDLPPTYYTLDEIASKMNCAPLKLNDAVEKLKSQGFNASMTSLNPSGFRTDCEIDKIIEVFRS